MLKALTAQLFRYLLLPAVLIGIPVAVFATHSWNGYHWARTSNPFVLKVGDNVSAAWDSYLAVAASDWTQSTVLDMNEVPGSTNPKNCRPTSGRVEVCNSKYGNNGWLGLAQIWVSGDHILQGTTKMNDTYFNTPTYNKPAWRQLVVCQEVGHTLGLDHQDETFNNTNLGTCMDYTNDPDGTIYGQLSNEHPNQHDYDELALIYSHLDSTTTVGQTTAKNPSGMPAWVAEGTFDNASDWGKELRNNGRVGLYERDFGGGNKLFTFVIFAR